MKEHREPLLPAEEIPTHRSKKNTSRKKSDHKHLYSEWYYVYEDTRGESSMVSKERACTICGRTESDLLFCLKDPDGGSFFHFVTVKEAKLRGWDVRLCNPNK